MDNSFFKLDEDDSIAVDADTSFLNLSGTPSRAGSDFSFYGDTSLFSGDQSPPSPLFKTPVTPAKRKKIEEKMNPAETSFSPSAIAPGDESQLFHTAIKTPAKKMNSSFSSSAPTPKTQVNPMKETDIPAPATTPDPKRKEMMDDQDKEIPSNLKETMEAQMKGLLDSLKVLEDYQVQGGDQLLAKADAMQEDVSAYKEELANVKEDYMGKINLASSFLNPGST